jgi:site-specific DNA recombinase
VGKGIERLLSAYQEALMSIEELRERMPALRQREQKLRGSHKQLLTSRTIGQSFCAWRKPSRRSLPAYTALLIR